MKSLIRKLFTGQDLTSAGQSSTVYPQRIADENGAWQAQVNQDPGGAATGTIKIMGRLSDQLDWAEIDSINISSLSGAGSYPHSVIRADIDIVPQMRAEIVSPGSVTGGTTLEVSLME